MEIVRAVASAILSFAAKSIKGARSASWIAHASIANSATEWKVAMNKGDVRRVHHPYASAAMEAILRFVKWTVIVLQQPVLQAVSAMRRKTAVCSVWRIPNARRTLLTVRIGPACSIAVHKFTMRSVAAVTVSFVTGTSFALITRRAAFARIA
jgi:hypothetical protein